jgi:hypothetical protein
MKEVKSMDHQHQNTFVVVALAALACHGARAGDSIPGSINFENQTGSRIVQTVAEIAMNEKEVEFGDFDNDSDLDVVVANAHSDFGTRKNKLYRNDAGTFQEVSGAPIIPLFATPDVARNAFFRDYNGDGWLDIIVVCDANTSGDGGRTKIYINQHPGDVFSHFTEEGLVRLGADTGGAACGAFSHDSDGDGFADLYVGNYPGPSQDTMYLNDQTGFFDGVTATMVPSDGDYTVDVASGDMNGDGKLDLLISNWSANRLYLNNNNDAGSADGDYSYTGSNISLGDSTSNENAMEPGDFDGDGDLDIYWTNRNGAADVILLNTGNNGSGVPQFSNYSTLPQSVVARTSRKASVADLNGDDRLDLVVFKEDGTNSRPTVLRNTSYSGNLSFVDWTPALAFPNSATSHKAWHGAIFDTNGDGDLDVLLGGWSNEHLFEQVPVAGTNEADIPGGDISSAFNGQPVAIIGSAPIGQSDSFIINGLTGTTANPAFVSVVLTGSGDYLLELLDGETVIVSSDRGALGAEEAFQASGLAGTRTIRVTVIDGEGGGSNAADFDSSGNVDAGDLGALLATWGKCPDCATDLDGDEAVGASDLGELLANWGPVVGGDVPYVLEVLSRN